MSMPCEPVDDLNDMNAEDVPVSELFFVLKSAFQPKDFFKVEEILKGREERMKSETDKWKKQFELIEKTHGELVLTKLEIEDELKKCKRECAVLREKITCLDEDKRVYLDKERVYDDRENRAQARYDKLLEDFEKLEVENRKLSTKNTELDSAKIKAELEIENSKKKNEEYNFRVTRLEEEMEMLKSMPVGQPVSAGIVEGEKQSTHKTGTGNSIEAEVKEVILNDHEEDNPLAGAGSDSDTLRVRKIHLKEAGPCSDIMACNEGKTVQSQMVLGSGSSKKVTNTSVVAGEITGSGVVIEIVDSDDENPMEDQTPRVPNVVAPDVIVREKETKISNCGRPTGENQSITRCYGLLASSKRKRETYSSDSSSSDSDCDSATISEMCAKVKVGSQGNKSGLQI